MAVKPIPEGYHSLTPYLIVEGVERLIEFLTTSFGASETHRSTAPDGRIMHCDLKIGDSHVMLAEASGPWPAMPGSIYFYTDDTDAAYRRAIDAGATSIMEPADQFYGDRNAGVKDPSGNMWWIATHIEDVDPDEVNRRAQAHAAARSQ